MNLVIGSSVPHASSAAGLGFGRSVGLRLPAWRLFCMFLSFSRRHSIAASYHFCSVVPLPWPHGCSSAAPVGTRQGAPRNPSGLTFRSSEPAFARRLISGASAHMDPSRFPELVAEPYGLVTELEQMFQRPFTPDGHMVGSLGEALAAHHYDLTLLPCSTPGCDATIGEKRVEIKATQGSRVAFRCKPDYLLVLQINRDGSFDEVYNGRGDRVWELVAHKPKPTNGQWQVSLGSLRRLNGSVHPSERIERTR